MDHPLVRLRDREPYVIGTGLPVWEVVEVVSATGSVAQAAAALGLSTTVVQAAADFAEEHSADAPDTSRE